MRKLSKQIALYLLILALGLCLFPVSVSAAGYTLGDSGYTRLSTLSNTLVATQGMAADETYIYTLKTPNGDNNNAIIYRTDISGGSTFALTAPDGSYYLSGLGHGNDMCAVVHNGKTYLYVATI